MKIAILHRKQMQSYYAAGNDKSRDLSLESCSVWNFTFHEIKCN